MKVFADNTINVTKVMNSVFHGVKNIAEKGKMPVTNIIYFSPHDIFIRVLLQGCKNLSGLCGKGFRKKQHTYKQVGLCDPRTQSEPLVFEPSPCPSFLQVENRKLSPCHPE